MSSPDHEIKLCKAACDFSASPHIAMPELGAQWSALGAKRQGGGEARPLSAFTPALLDVLLEDR